MSYQDDWVFAVVERVEAVLRYVAIVGIVGLCCWLIVRLWGAL